MLKHLILPAIALMLSFSSNAQVKAGLAFDYEHINAPAYYNVGSGSGFGGSVFFRAPLSHNLGIDWSLDIAGGHTTYQFYPFSPDPGWPSHITPVKRSFVYTGLPVYLVYSLSFRTVRVFAGAGPSLSMLSMDDAQGHGWSMGSNYIGVAASFKAGVQLFQHLLLSGEFRPWIATVNKTAQFQYDRYKVSNQLSVKLGYEIGTIRSAKHSAGKKHPNP